MKNEEISDNYNYLNDNYNFNHNYDNNNSSKMKMKIIETIQDNNSHSNYLDNNNNNNNSIVLISLKLAKFISFENNHNNINKMSRLKLIENNAILNECQFQSSSSLSCYDDNSNNNNDIDNQDTLKSDHSNQIKSSLLSSSSSLLKPIKLPSSNSILSSPILFMILLIITHINICSTTSSATTTTTTTTKNVQNDLNLNLISSTSSSSSSLSLPLQSLTSSLSSSTTLNQSSSNVETSTFNNFDLNINNNGNDTKSLNDETTTIMANVSNDNTNDTKTSIDDDDDLTVLRIEKPKWLKSNKLDDEDGDDYDDYYEDGDDNSTGSNANNNNSEPYNSICTASYFFDRIIPDDYPFEISKDVKHINETIERLNRMYTFTNKVLERLNPFLREMVSRMTDYLYESQLDSDCMGALFRVFRAINHRETWAMNFLDASGSVLIGGFQQGMFVSLGEFDQCLEIESDPMENPNIIYGQYCLLKPVVPLPDNFNQGEPIAETSMPRVKKFLNDEYIDTYLGLYKFMQRTFLRVGLCLPHKCEKQSVENAINRILVRKTGMSVQVGPECVKATDDPHINPYQIIFLSLFSILLSLIIISTIYEIVYRHLFENRHTSSTASIASDTTNVDVDHIVMPSTLRVSKLYICKPRIVQILTSFSIIRNTRHLFDAPSPNRYQQLDTMRLLLIIFFFITNVYYYTMLFAPMIIKRFYVQGPLQFISEKKYFFIRMYYLIDVFVVFSGIALAISFRSKTFIYFNYVLRNYIRYTLPIIISIGLIYIVPLFGSGPLWHLFDQTMTQPCKDHLWSALFFTNNFQSNIEDMCNLPTVFVSMIFQLKLIAPIILIISSCFNSEKHRNIFHLILFTLSTIGNLIYRFYFDLKIPYEHRKMKSFMEIKQSIMFYLFNPFPHLQPLIIGLWVGHLIVNKTTQLVTLRSKSKIADGQKIDDDDDNGKLHKASPRSKSFYNTLIGLITLASFFTCFFFIENLNLVNPNITTLRLTMMLTLGRPMLVGLHAWIVYSCIKGHITIVNRFLSSIAFRPISKLSYGFFLTSIVVTCYRLFSIRQTIILSAQTMFRSIVSDAVISFFFAYFMHLMIQQPMRNLLQLNLLSTDYNSSLFTSKNQFDTINTNGKSNNFGKYYLGKYSASIMSNSNNDKGNDYVKDVNQDDQNQSKSIDNVGDHMIDSKINNRSSIMLNISNVNNQSSMIVDQPEQPLQQPLQQSTIILTNECSKF